MLRILKPDGTLIVGAMSFIGASLYYLDGIRYEKDQFGLEATKWLFNTGIQDEEHYPVPRKHYVHMMRSSEMEALFEGFPVFVKNGVLPDYLRKQAILLWKTLAMIKNFEILLLKKRFNLQNYQAL